jgi:hypothetical protein
VLPTPRLVSTMGGWRYGDLVLDGLDGPYPVPGEPAPKAEPEPEEP